MSTVTIPQAFAFALQHHRAGQLAEAETVCRQILAVQARHADALHLLGIIAHQTGRYDLAVESIQQAIGLDPNNAAAHSNLGEAFRALGRVDESLACYQRALQWNPNDPLAHYNLGLALAGLRRFTEAVASHGRAVALQPEFAEAHNSLGNALREAGRLDEAVSAYRRALDLRPAYSEAHNNLGNALRDQNQLDAAVAAFRQAIALKPGYPEAHNNLGNVLQERGQMEEALGCYRRVLELKPDYPEAHNNLGNLLRKLGQLDLAIDAYDRALALNPTYGQAAFNLGNARKDQGDLDAALAAYRRAIHLMPESIEARSSLVFLLHYLPGLDHQTLLTEREKWNRQVTDSLRNAVRPHAHDRNPDRRLRIGYVSSDFREHVVGRNLRPLLRCHDRQNFEILCYSGVTRADRMTEEFHGYANEWRNTAGLSDEALAEMIRQDGVDILVDLAQHTAGNRLPVFARRPAPVQVSFMGYPESTGLEAIEYRISDRWLEAEAEADGKRKMENGKSATPERVMLVDSFWCYEPEDSDLGANALPARENGRITFGSLNNFCKINEPILKLWARVLGKVKGSRLILLSTFGSHRERTIHFLEQEGIERKRVEFVAPLAHRAYLEQYHRLDFVLDPAPYNGHTTSLDALWMGVPVVSLVGRQPVSRGGWSQLSNLGLAELAASTEDEYVRIAVELARDQPRLEELRATLRPRMEASVLMDAASFARQVEGAYRAIWRQWCGQKGGSHKPARQNFELALKHYENGQMAEAEALCRETLAADPDDADAWHLSGIIAYRTGQPEAAVERMSRAIQLDPDNAEIHSNLGETYRALGRLDEALASYRQALQLQPNFPAAAANLSHALTDTGRLDEAIAAGRQALQMKPDYPEAHNSLGVALAAQDRLEEAATAYRQALKIRPDYVEACNNLGIVLTRQGCLDEAVAAYRHLLRLQPNLAEGYNNLGHSLKILGQLDEAVAAFRQAIQLQPGNAQVQSNLIHLLHFVPQSDETTIREEQHRWNARFGHPPARVAASTGNDRHPERRLRIGYVSPNLRDHVIGTNVLPLFQHHDHQAFEIVCYSDVLNPDRLTEEFHRRADRWRNVAGTGDEALASMVREDGVDILVDLTQHLAGNRLPMFAHRPAPVQVSFAGYPDSAGVEAIGYRISDRWLEPAMADGKWKVENGRSATPERVFLLDSFWCYDPCEIEIGVKGSPAQESGRVTFGCLNNFCKVNEPMLRLWARVLERVPHSCLVLLSPAGSARQRTREILERSGLAANRVEFVDWGPQKTYLERHHRLDIILDTFPYNGHTTSQDALWMGVPVVSLAGQSPVSRAGLSILHNLDLPELVAETAEDFVQVATDLALDLPRLVELRTTLRARMEASVLMDGARFTRQVEAGYREMWRQWCSGSGPQP